MTRIKLRAALAAALIAFGFLQTTHAATLEWMRTLGTTEEDVSYGISADGLGNLYIAGATNGSLGGPNLGKWDAFVSKYDTAGNLQWTSQFGTSADDYGFGVTSDQLGNVFVAGHSKLLDPVTGSTNYGFVTCVDSNGNTRWTADLRTPTFGYVEAHSAIADGLGNVYITGRIARYTGDLAASRFDIFLSKFDSAGGLQWTTQLASDYDDEARAVSTDGLGNVYVGGSYGSVRGGATLVKYDDAGVSQWIKQVTMGSRRYPFSTSVSADRFGNIYVVGGGPDICYNSNCSQQFISKYDSAGSQLWIHELEPLAGDVLSSIWYESGLEVSADGLGNAYVTGFVNVSKPGQRYSDAFISKYDALGNHLETTMLGNGSSSNAGLGIVADGLGNVYITGQTNAIPSGGSSTYGDTNAFIAKFRDDAVPEPAGIVSAVAGLLIVAMRCRRFSARGVPIKSASRRDAATCGRVAPRLARNVVS